MIAAQPRTGLIVAGPKDFSLEDTLTCGQCFRFFPQPDGSFEGVAQGRFLKIAQQNDSLLFYNTSPEEFEGFWRGYFDLDRDYGAIKQRLSQDKTLKKAAEYAPGIRILKQDFWEALCCFIFSQNNNIKRIMGITERFCEAFGDLLPQGRHSFPSSDRIAPLSREDLCPLRCGFRADYLLDAARKVSSGEIDGPKIRGMPLEEARTVLQTIRGVGPKVAECVLLYGLNRLDAFPVDVWIKRALDRYYGGTLPNTIKEYAGIAQQYLFHYIRTAEKKA